MLTEIEAQVRAIQDRKAGLADRAAAGDLIESEDARVKLGEGGFYDTEIYDGSKGKFEGYVTSIAATDEQDVSLLIKYICRGAVHRDRVATRK